MKLICAAAFLLLIVGFTASFVYSQGWPPHMQIQFSNGLEAADCPDAPPGSIIDSLYIIARFVDCWMQGFEFKVSYPPAIMFLEDYLLCEPDLWIPPFPTSETGLSISCKYPIPCSPHCVVDKVHFMWMCHGCTVTDIPVVVIPFGPEGRICITCWPDDFVIHLIGMTSLICSTLPVEETSWGRIKSLYNSY
jgi:hypothetical protein